MTADGWVFYLLPFLFMAAIFAAIPFTDAMIVRYVDDAMRSRVSGMRLAVSFGASSLAVADRASGEAGGIHCTAEGCPPSR